MNLECQYGQLVLDPLTYKSPCNCSSSGRACALLGEARGGPVVLRPCFMFQLPPDDFGSTDKEAIAYISLREPLPFFVRESLPLFDAPVSEVAEHVLQYVSLVICIYNFIHNFW